MRCNWGGSFLDREDDRERRLCSSKFGISDQQERQNQDSEPCWIWRNSVLEQQGQEDMVFRLSFYRGLKRFR